eukprot:TRINITY_DN1302_c0_g2_i1.p1 TRINITY_DN1302_c0_g2~~TRINITY_DN1302_c0_g2_i1.p1  ORF type:complete len:501 (+),score=129.31 TRINITY_DN1302_c0_g2_i1:85-1587(+)
MSSIVCAISGVAPEEPVFCQKTGHVYEKRLITKQIEAVGKCPVTNEDLTQDDLATLKTNKVVRPRPANATSIPGMLSLLQSEWDALMTETYNLKTHLDTTRKQLSHALYQHDAACRVIARLMRERDGAREKVAQLQDQMANMQPAAAGGASAGANDTAELGLTPELIQRMQDVAKDLSKKRKRKDFPGLAPVAEVQTMACAGSHPVHQSTAPGILCVDVHKENDAKVVSGGMDSQVILFDAKKEKCTQKLSGHSKKVLSVAFHPTEKVVLSASQDKTARVWASGDADGMSGYTCAHVIKRHSADVTSLSLHPLGDYFLTASLDKSWAIHELSTGRCVRHVQDQESPYACMKFHPDGLLAAGCMEKNVAVYDVKAQNVVATLQGHEGDVKDITFSENGYYLASASTDGTVKLWDLRKPLNIQTLQMDAPVNCVRFDSTGQYLVAAADRVQVFNFVTKSQLGSTVELKDHEAAVTGVCFGMNARTIASVSMDRTLKVYRIPA